MGVHVGGSVPAGGEGERMSVRGVCVWGGGGGRGSVQWRRQDIREGGAELYAREIFDHAPSLTVKVEVHDVVPCAF